MRVKWEIADGYAGGSRPQYSDIPEDELRDLESVEEMIQFIDEYLYEDMSNRFYPAWDDEDYRSDLEGFLGAESDD